MFAVPPRAPRGGLLSQLQGDDQVYMEPQAVLGGVRGAQVEGQERGREHGPPSRLPEGMAVRGVVTTARPVGWVVSSRFPLSDFGFDRMESQKGIWRINFFYTSAYKP